MFLDYSFKPIHLCWERSFCVNDCFGTPQERIVAAENENDHVKDEPSPWVGLAVFLFLCCFLYQRR